MRIGMVVNPRARSASDPQLPARLQALAARAGVACQVAVTHRPEDLPSTLAALGADGLDVLAVCGGDGTLMTTLSAVIAYYRQHAAAQALPALLLLPAGTMNTVAKNLGLTVGPEQLLQALLDAAQRRGLSAVPFWAQETLQVRTYGETPFDGSETTTHAAPDEPPIERYGFLFSGAMGARFLAAYSRGKPPGLRWASLLALRTIASCLYPGGGELARWLFQPTAARLTVDSGDGSGPVVWPETAYRLLLLATVPDVGLGMQVPWRAGGVPDRFQLIASGLSTVGYALQVPRMLRGEPLSGTPHHDQLVRTVQLRFAASQPLVLDGELFCAPAVDVELGPRLRVLRPR